MQDLQTMNVLAFDEPASTPSAAATSTIRSRSNSAILGDIAWLMMESDWHRGRRVEDFARLVMPPVGRQQFRLYHTADVPIAYFSWALLSPEAESRFLVDPLSLEPADWVSGEAIYLVDFIAPKGALRKIAPYLRADPLLSQGPVRGLRTRNGVRMMIEIMTRAGGKRIGVTRLD